MKLADALVDWVIETRVLTEHHVTRGSGDGALCTIVPEAARAAESGHLVFYILYNLAQQRGATDAMPPASSLRGAPGESVSEGDRAANWAVVTKAMQVLGMSDAVSLTSGVAERGGMTRVLTHIRDYSAAVAAEDAELQAAEANQSSGLDVTDTNARPAGSKGSTLRAKIDDDIMRSQQKFLRKQQAEEAKRRAEERKARNAKMLSDVVAMGLDVERHRLDLTAVGTAPLPAYTEFRNRAAVATCHGIIEAIIAEVASGAATERLDAQWEEQQRVRQAARERKEQGRRLVDRIAAPMSVPKEVDRRVFVLCRELVDGIVARSMDPNTIDDLLARDAERVRERDIVRSLNARLQKERDERPDDVLPLKQRMEQAKLAAKEEEEAEARRREDRTAAFRRENREYAQEQQERRQRKEAAEAAAKAEERRQQQRKRVELEEHKAKGRMLTLNNKMRRLLLEMEAEERSTAAQEEATAFKRIKGVATREARLLREQLAADNTPTTTLASVSVGTGLAAGYTGETYGSQYLTALEHEFIEAVAAVRSSPVRAADAVAQLRTRYINQKLMFEGSQLGSTEPMMTVEGPRAADEAAAALAKQRAVRPARPEPSIGLTLAARQHAVDLAYNGIANLGTHVGTDKSSLSQRVGRYGWGRGLGGANASEFVIGVVRHAQHNLGAADFIDLVLLADGEANRASRKALFGTGDSCSSCGVGHATAHLEDRVVEVFCVIFAADFEDKPVGQMATAHNAAIGETAAPFLLGQRAVRKGIQLRQLFATTNITIGRTAPAPDLRSLTQPTPSPRRRTLGGLQPARGAKPRPYRNTTVSQQPAAEQEAFDAPPPEENNKGRGRKLSPVRQRPQPTPAPVQDDHPVSRTPTPRSNFVSTPPLPPIHDPPPQQKQRNHGESLCVVRAAARFKVGLVRSRRRQAEADINIQARTLEAQAAAVLVQSLARGRAARKLARAAASDRRAELAELEAEAERQEREAEAAASAEHDEASHTVAAGIMKEVADAAFYEWALKHAQGEIVGRCRTLLRRSNADDRQIFMQLGKYEGRERLLLKTLIERFGTDVPDIVATATDLFRKLSISTDMDGREETDEQRGMAAARLGEVAGDEADFVAKHQALVWTARRCGQRWRRNAHLKSRGKLNGSTPEEAATLSIQRMFRARASTERKAYVAGQRPRIHLKLRLERFYGRYNAQKIPECGVLASKYVGSDERLFTALVAKYGPEPPVM